MAHQLFVCSSNRGKLRDFASVAHTLAEASIIVQPLPGLEHIAPPEENGSSFEQNAIEKAIYYSSFSPALVLADDSGLEVESLNNAPGVHSARYAGLGATDEENNELLLANLADAGERRARFVCTLAVARGGQTLTTAKGTVEGIILRRPQGSAGFGYDPLFFYPPLERSFAELTPEDKLAVSHRGRALSLLFERLRDLLPA